MPYKGPALSAAVRNRPARAPARCKACKAGAENPSSRRGRGPVDQGRLLAVVVYRKGAEAVAAMLARKEERAA